MSGLENILQRYINADGPMDLARFMELCLTHPDYGYYVTRDPLGKDGDFTTAPEVSQMFGEMIGIWCAILWNNIGMPGSLKLVELGPGRGTLMADLVRGTQNIKGLHDALSITFVEKSPVLQMKQKEAITDAGFQGAVNWADDLSLLNTRDPVFILANEFIDALPIRQFEFTEAGWMERRVGHEFPDGFYLGLSPADTHWAELMPKEPAIGDVIEKSPARDAYIEKVINALSKKGGAALFIDYGHDISKAVGDTFQAVKNHEYVDPIEHIGKADLTSHVDFNRIRQIAEERQCHVYGSVEQGTFLHKLGIGPRAENLAKADEKKAKDIHSQYQRLTAEDQMGKLFRVMAITKKLDGEPLL